MKRPSETMDSLGRRLENIGNPQRKSLFISIVLFFFILLPSWWITSSWYQDGLIQDQKTSLAGRINIHGNALTTAINKRFSLLDGLFAFTSVNASDEILKTNFAVFAAGLYSGTTGIRVFAIAPKGVVRYIYPFQGNEAALGHDLLNDPSPGVRNDTLRAITTRKTIIAGPYELKQGGLGLVARKALYLNDTLWGLVAMIIDMPPIFKEAGLQSELENIEMALQDSSGKLFFESETAFKNEPAKLRIELPEGYWELGGVPKGGWHQAVAKKFLFFQASGLIISILIAIIIYLLVSRYLLLDEKNKNLEQSHLDLEQKITERKQAEESLEAERSRLQQALDEVRTLRGIVPICSYCKKIRDDEGYWNQVEQYVSEHSEAKFSHGICPTCFEKEMKGLKP
jgi:sensor domain CHASE-containing protein